MAEQIEIGFTLRLDELHTAAAEAKEIIAGIFEDVEQRAEQSTRSAATAATASATNSARTSGSQSAGQGRSNSSRDSKGKDSAKGKKKDEPQGFEEIVKDNFEDFALGISRSFNRAFTSIIRGGQNLRATLKGLLADIAGAFAQTALDIALDWLAQQIFMTNKSVEEAKKRAATEISTAVQVQSVSADVASTGILNHAARAGAAAFAAIAEIPVVGPVLAPAAAAAAFAGALAFGDRIASAERGFDVPHDTFAFLHKDEMVLPAPLAERVRDLTEPVPRRAAGAPAPAVGTVVINALDADSVRRLLRRNPGAVAAAAMMAKRSFMRL